MILQAMAMMEWLWLSYKKCANSHAASALLKPKLKKVAK
jgi:hypothetical protein